MCLVSYMGRFIGPHVFDITGLDKAEVLLSLYNACRQLPVDCLDPAAVAPLTLETAQQYINRGGAQYYTYLNGRVLNIDLTTDRLRTRLYNIHNGRSCAAEIALAPLCGAGIEPCLSGYRYHVK